MNRERRAQDALRPGGWWFSDRGWPWKPALVAGLLVLMGHDLERRGRELRPDPVMLKEAPARYDGREVWLPYARVRSPEARAFSAWADPVSIPVLHDPVDPPLAEGDRVLVRGHFRAAGSGYVRADVIRVLPGYVWRRGLVYLYSIVALAALGWWASRRLRCRWAPPVLEPIGEPHGRTAPGAEGAGVGGRGRA